MNFVHFILKSMIFSLLFCDGDGRRKKNRNHGRVSKNILNSEGGVKICKTSTKYAFDDSMFLLPFYDGIKREAIKRSKSQHEMRLPSLNESTCPKGFSQSPYRSTCPWHYVLNYEPNRIPSMVYEAECSCTNCLTEHSVGLNACDKIFTYRTVLMKKAGKNCYERHIKGFAVGCHCIGSSRLPPIGDTSGD